MDFHIDLFTFFKNQFCTLSMALILLCPKDQSCEVFG